jgi:CheY-like chemotaxis protein
MDSELQKIRPLVVDDSGLMCELMHGILRAVGVGPVTTAQSGAEALEILATASPGPNILFVDWEMEPMSGIELTRAIRRAPEGSKIDSYLPIIMVTAHTEMDKVLEARDAGIHEYLVKPITGRSLLSRLTEVINHPRPFIRTEAYVGPAPRRDRAGTPEDWEVVAIDDGAA